MTPAEAALDVAKNARSQCQWNYNVLETTALQAVAEAFERFADMLQHEESAPVSDGGPGEG